MEQTKIICKLCGNKFKNNSTLGQHIVREHKLTSKEYYDKFFKKPNEGLCKCCKAPTTYISLTSGYHQFCSNACFVTNKRNIVLNNINKDEFIEFYNSHSDLDTRVYYGNINVAELKFVLNAFGIKQHTRKENTEFSMLARYGVKHQFLNEATIKKSEQTKLKRYGDAHYNNQEKYKQTCIKKYNVINTFQLDQVKEKSKQTCLKHYGVTNAAKSADIQYKMRCTRFERYDNENFNNREKARVTTMKCYGIPVYGGSEQQIKKAFKTRALKHGSVKKSYQQTIQKVQQTKLEKYGDANYNNFEKAYKTKLEKYGNGYYTNKEKAMQTLYERYGVKSPMYVPEFKEKALKHEIETCMKKYGVPYTCLIIKSPYKKYSSPNQNFNNLLIENGFEIDDKKNREFTLQKYSFDFIIENTLIEINPSATHNSTWCPYGDHKGLNKNYHYNKTQCAKDNGYHCIHVWDWDDLNKIVFLLKSKEKVFARKCKIKLVPREEEKLFINTYHLQNYVKSTIAIGLYYNDELVSIMTFGKSRYNKNYEYELLRYCSAKAVVGGAEKLFKYFVKNYSPNSIISYCDYSKFNGDIYLKLGFKYSTKKLKPSKHWYNIKTKKHITDNLLRQRGFDQLLGKEYGYYGKGTNNEELMRKHKFVEIYDCGQATYTWKSNKIKQEEFNG